MSHPASHDEPLIVSVSGLRGVVGASLTDEVAVRYIHAFVTTLPPGPIVVGRDGRQSGPPLAAAITAHRVRLGRDVIAILDGLKIKKTNWCGLSMGGMVGQELATGAKLF